MKYTFGFLKLNNLTFILGQCIVKIIVLIASKVIYSHSL